MRFPNGVAIGVVFVLSLPAPAQDERKLTARELFYTPVSASKPAAVQPVNPPVADQTKNRPAGTQSTPQSAQSKPTSRPPRGSGSNPPAQMSAGARLENSTYALEGDLPPLALRYSLIESDTNQEIEVDRIFRSGDKFRVAVESNDNGFLYILHQGSSKSWTPLFPNEDINGGQNHIQRNRRYEIPSQPDRFIFDEKPGVERLFIVLTRKPVTDLEGLIYSLREGGAPTPASTPTPTRGAAPAKMLMAGARPIDDGMLGRVRNQLIARDLVFEKVNEKTAGVEKKEKAMYVATQDRSGAARVVVDLNLEHR